MEGKIGAVAKNNEARAIRELHGAVEGNYDGVPANLPQVQKSILVCVWVGISLVLKSVIVPFY